MAVAPTEPAVPSPTTPPDDRTQPSLTITVDPPKIAWDEQATIVVRASDPAGIKDVALVLGDQVLGAGQGEELQVEFIPGAIDGLAGGKSYTLTARAADMAGNQAEASASIVVGPETTPSPVPKAVTPTERSRTDCHAHAGRPHGHWGSR